MSLSLARSRLALIGSIVVIAALVLFNVGYWLFYPSLQTSNLIEPDLLPPDGMVSQPVVEQSWLTSIWLLVVLAIGLLLLAVIAWWLLNRLQQQSRHGRDEQRRQALSTLQQGLAAYAAATGHYPVATKVEQRAVPAVGLGYEWDRLGFPADEEWHRHVPSWPVVDPLVPYDDHKQVNQYLYYPKNEGQTYVLYAHLEALGKEAVDYNQLAGLPRAWGDYNFALEPAPPAAPTMAGTV
jgi:hypothetical protein